MVDKVVEIATAISCSEDGEVVMNFSKMLAICALAAGGMVVSAAQAAAVNPVWNGYRGEYGSADAACKSIFDQFIGAGGTNSILPAKQVSGSKWKCDWTHFQRDGAGFTTIIPSSVFIDCPFGSNTKSSNNGDGATCSPPAVSQPVCNAMTPNPINLANGSKFLQATDFASADGRFRIERHYQSVRSSNALTPRVYSNLGPLWRFSDDYSFGLSALGPESFKLQMDLAGISGLYFESSSLGIGKPARAFTLTAGNEAFRVKGYTIRATLSGTVENSARFEMVEPSGRKITFQTFRPSGDDTSDYTLGRVVKSEWLDGYTQSFERESDGRLRRMTDNLGRYADFGWDEYEYVIDDDELQPRLKYPDGSPLPPVTNRLTTVTLYDGSAIVYTYEDADDASDSFFDTKGRSSHLTGMSRMRADAVIHSEEYRYKDGEVSLLNTVIDAAGVEHLKVTYNDEDQATSSTRALGVNRYDVEYVSEGERRVTNALGRSSTYAFDIFRTQIKGEQYKSLAAINGDAAFGCEADTRSFAYDPQGSGVVRKVDREGRQTAFTHDAIGQVVEETRARGTQDEYTIETEWDPQQIGLRTAITAPGLTTRFSHSGTKVTEVELIDTSISSSTASRRWTIGYENGSVYPTSIDGPLPGPLDTSYYAWNGERLLSVTNEVGHVTTFGGFNLYNQPTRMTDPNGVITSMEYDLKNRLVRIMQDLGGREAVTNLAYDRVDQLTRIEMPDGSKLAFAWDSARRLKAVENAVGERMEFDHNLMGEVTRSRAFSPDGNVKALSQQVLDARNRVMSIVAGPNTIAPLSAAFTYDKESNPLSVMDGRGNSYQRSFDALDRLVKDVDPMGGITEFKLDKHDDSRNSLTAVTDARGSRTTYKRNAFGEVVAEVSPETGQMTYERDERGLVTASTDARGVRKESSYDAAGRLLSETFPEHPDSNVSYGYDEGDYGVGRLTHVIESFGRTDYNYDALGFLTNETRTIGGRTYTTAYTPDLLGNVIETTYPSGRRIVAERDAASRVVALSSIESVSGEMTQLLSSVGYEPFGPMNAASFGDGHELTIEYDKAYRGTRLQRTRAGTNLMDVAFTHDGNGNITQMTDAVRPSRSQLFTYDPLNRLTDAIGGYGELEYGYNPVGDRVSKISVSPDGDSTSEVYGYVDNRLEEITRDGELYRTIGYAASGQAISDQRSTGDLLSVSLDGRGRIDTVSNSTGVVASYAHDMHELRVVKSTPESTVHYHYDHEGRLIAETDGNTGKTLREYVWLGLTPIATFGAVAPTDPPGCDRTALDDVSTRLSQRLEAWSRVGATLTQVSGTLSKRQATRETVATRRDTLQKRYDTTSETNTARRADLAARIDRDTARLEELDNVIATLTSRVLELEERVATLDEAIERLERRQMRLRSQCDSQIEDRTADVGTLYFLHTDHLGRPAFATDPSGRTVWDGGITTPFGLQLSTLGSVTQNLMFPGQFSDVETGWFENWHRSYDPELGRYLQSDPIGLVGGLNRYAYVGGNPVRYTDPTGRIIPVIVAGFIGGAAIDFAGQVIANGLSGKPLLSDIDYGSIATSGVAGAFGGGVGFGLARVGVGIGLAAFGSGAASGGLDSAIRQFFDPTCSPRFDPKQIGEDALFGGLFGRFVSGSGSKLRQTLRNKNDIPDAYFRDGYDGFRKGSDAVPFTDPNPDNFNWVPPAVSTTSALGLATTNRLSE